MTLGSKAWSRTPKRHGRHYLQYSKICIMQCERTLMTVRVTVHMYVMEVMSDLWDCYVGTPSNRQCTCLSNMVFVSLTTLGADMYIP
jgi:hypothetical protein